MKQDGKQRLHSRPGRQKKRGGAGSRGFFHTLLRGDDAAADLDSAVHVSGNIGVIQFQKCACALFGIAKGAGIRNDPG